jgi:hypothetical protein
MKRILLSAVAVTLFSSQAMADNHLDTRGYQACEAELNKSFSDNGVMYKRQYKVKRTSEARTYYINKTIWKEGVRSPVVSTCVTSADGRDVIATASDFRPHVTIEDLVAAR